MTSQRILLLLCIAWLLTGCLRTADDDFVAVDAQNVSAPDTEDIASATPVIIEAATDTPEDRSDDAMMTEEAPAVLVTNSPQFDAQTGGATPTATIVIIEIASETPQAQPAATDTATRIPSPVANDGNLLPTSTEITVITPDLGGPSQIEFPTATPTVEAEETAEAGSGSSPGIDGDTDDVGVVGACDYVIQTGDNLFRIAINNNVSLNDLLVANNLTENAIIQPGETLTIPDCDSSDVVADDEADAMAEEDAGTAVPAGVTIHRVSSGETLSVIARQYGVSMQAIVDANELANPNSLSIGQELIIPDA